MGIKLTNNAFATLAAGINSSATSITLTTGQGARFPTLSAGDYFYATLVDTSNNLEIVKCTARSTDVLTVTRGQEGTTARAYSAGDRIEIRITAQTFLDATAITPTAVSDQTNSSTGYFDLPSGTTAQRPGSPTTGAIRFNTSISAPEIYDGTAWQNIGAKFPTASGGTITTSGNYKYHFFSGSDNFTVSDTGNSAGANTFDVLVVGGGGASSIQHSGGAGAGGLILRTNLSLATGIYPIVVGAGATVTSNTNSDDTYRSAGANGSNSSAFGLTALGGGGARPWAATDNNPGGSGGSGGSPWNAGTPGAGLQPSQSGESGTYGFGNASGSGSGASGGGAAAAGTGGGGTTGGAGKYIAEFSQFGANSGYFAGGGGGGNSVGGAGGIGGGGGGVPTGQGYPPSVGNGTANTGGGGGGGGDNTTCGSGGSGVVIIRYRYQ